MYIAELWTLAALLLAGPAAAQTRVTLPTDSNLSAYVGATGRFRPVLSGQTRKITMASWMAAFAPNEPFDFSALTHRPCQVLGLPHDGGWGYITCEDDKLSVTVAVADASKRLGLVRVYEVDSGAIVARIGATVHGTRAKSVLKCNPDVRNYRIEILDKRGAVLSMLAVDLGKWDTVDWCSSDGGFEPYYPTPIACGGYTPKVSTDFLGTEAGDPGKAPGVKTYPGRPAPRPFSTACLDYTNDTSAQESVPPPAAFGALRKRHLVYASVGPGAVPLPDGPSRLALGDLVISMTKGDPTPALSTVEVLPYSRSYGYWQVVLSGEATAVMGAGHERIRTGGNLARVVGAASRRATPQSGLLSAILKTNADEWLADPANQRISGMKPGDVFPLGDIYMVDAVEKVAQSRNPLPILQDVTFTLQPDIAPESGSGSVTVMVAAVGAGSSTTPAPPGPANGGTLSLASPGFSGTMRLPKGYRYTVSGCVNPASAYVSAPASEFLVPGSTSVMIPCTLTKLLKWNIVTTSPIGVGAYVQVLNGTQVVYKGNSTLQNGKFVYTISQPVPPGAYTVQASVSVSGYPRPTTYSGTVDVTVNPALALETTVNLTAQ